MKKVIGLVALGLLLCTSFAVATETFEAVNLNGRAIPQNIDRDGSCVLTQVPDTATTVGGFTMVTIPGQEWAVYLDPAVNQDGAGGCTAPLYPFHLNSIDVIFAIFSADSAASVGQTATITASVHCPYDLASGSVTESCHGPGTVVCSGTIADVSEPADWEGLWVINVPLDCCVDRPFWISIRVDSWTGPADLLAQVWHRDPSPTQDRCGWWVYGALGNGFCWFNPNNLDVGYTCVSVPTCNACSVGSPFMYVNGDAGVVCSPVTACAARPNLYPGDDESDPINVNTTPWTATLDMCGYTSDYEYILDSGTPNPCPPSVVRRFSGRSHDVVLDINLSQNPAEACFNVLLTPLCPPAPAFRHYRFRTWLKDSVAPLFWGAPQYPTFNTAQTYNMTAAGAGCQFPDRYLLFIDTQGGCCCPIRVDYSGDQPLPVELVSLTAIAGDGVVRLDWNTRAENNIEFYEIQRDGHVLAEVPGLGDSPTGHRYTYEDRAVENGLTYGYRLVAYGFDGTTLVFGQQAFATPMSGLNATDYALAQNYPNPFNPTTSITYSVKDAGSVSLKVFSVDGREVATLVNENQDANIYTVNFDGAGLASGVYLYTLEVNGFSATHKMVLMK